MVTYCLPVVEYLVPNWYDLCNTCPNIYICLRFLMTTTLSLNTLLPICSWTQHFPTGFSASPPTPAVYLSHGMSKGLMGNVSKTFWPYTSSMCQYHRACLQACYLLLFYTLLCGHGKPHLLSPGGNTCLVNWIHCLVAGSPKAVPSVIQSRLSLAHW